MVGSVAALAATVRITWNERVMVKSVYTCIANHCLYRIDLQTDDVDWNGYQDLFARDPGFSHLLPPAARCDSRPALDKLCERRKYSAGSRRVTRFIRGGWS